VPQAETLRGSQVRTVDFLPRPDGQRTDEQVREALQSAMGL
jgi:hypothetical protein